MDPSKNTLPEIFCVIQVSLRTCFVLKTSWQKDCFCIITHCTITTKEPWSMEQISYSIFFHVVLADWHSLSYSSSINLFLRLKKLKNIVYLPKLLRGCLYRRFLLRFLASWRMRSSGLSYGSFVQSYTVWNGKILWWVYSIACFRMRKIAWRIVRVKSSLVFVFLLNQC